jgi:transcriptional regulator with GAF, ATPase, and Fis domain
MDNGAAAGVAWSSKIVQELLSVADEEHTLLRVAELAVAAVRGCDWAGITLRIGDKLETPAWTHDIALRADRLQYELDEGPCVDAVWVDELILVRETATDPRWPRWAPAARELGIQSVLSVRLATQKQAVGGLNLYSCLADAFDEDDVQVAHYYAAHAATALAVSHEISTLRSALQTRHSIGVAQGILMTRYQLSLDQAFEVLRRTSQQYNVKLRDLAAEVVAAHGLPQTYRDAIPTQSNGHPT